MFALFIVEEEGDELFHGNRGEEPSEDAVAFASACKVTSFLSMSPRERGYSRVHCVFFEEVRKFFSQRK
uniref:Uncharacterized protein n=1 Tax=Chromera velia CCMP2878 TaxID=1169474 RepID=A0A0G4G5Y6_9ALVE|eukprot:Cvel_4224.t1-p1 / transcript=Cvel_4224.t1 / gene=Cvel_4224 / organism=Chromera_velia_CCMP2878 / gene_product=hypothetical protein / transcript_product=hypothetical protein / location=Cvel_scaffold182:104444-104647(-) / protein_length=68 / sequence_SO=supercontig / SO=protein_coding / is_pseudo=false